MGAQMPNIYICSHTPAPTSPGTGALEPSMTSPWGEQGQAGSTELPHPICFPSASDLPSMQQQAERGACRACALAEILQRSAPKALLRGTKAAFFPAHLL